MFGIVDNGQTWHSITSTLFQGGVLAMGLAIVFRLVTTREWYYRGLNMRLSFGTMAVLLVVWNLVFAVLSMITGIWMTWGYETVVSMSITLNKAMFGTFALVALAIMAGMRFKYGPDLWGDVALKGSYAALGFVVVAAAIVNGSLGGEATLTGSVMSTFWDMTGVVPRYPMVLPSPGGIALIAAVVALTAAVVVVRVVRRKASS